VDDNWITGQLRGVGATRGFLVTYQFMALTLAMTERPLSEGMVEVAAGKVEVTEY
jgi:hypothetical protein